MDSVMSFNEGMFYDGIFDQTTRNTITRSKVGLLANAFYKISFGELRIAYAVTDSSGNGVATMVTRHGAPCLELSHGNISGYTIKNWTVELRKRGKNKFEVSGKTIGYVLSKFKNGAIVSEIIAKKNKSITDLMQGVKSQYIRQLPDLSYTFDGHHLSRPEYREMFNILLQGGSLSTDSSTYSKLARAHEHFQKFDAEATEKDQELEDTFHNDFFIIAHYKRFVGVGVYHYTLDNKLVDTIPFRLYKSFDALPDEMRERLRMALMMCRINREQTGMADEVSTVDDIPCSWDRKVYRDTTSLSFGTVNLANYTAAWFVTPY